MAKTKNEEQISSNPDAKLMDYSEFKKMQKNFDKSEAEVGIGVKIAAFVTLIIALPALFIGLYLIVLGVVSILQSYDVIMIGGNEVNSSNFIFNTWGIGLWNNMIGSVPTFDNVNWAIDPIDVHFSLISIIFTGLVFNVTFGIFALYWNNIKLLQGKANNRWLIVFFNFIIFLPLIMFFAVMLYAFTQTPTIGDPAQMILNWDVKYEIVRDVAFGVVFVAFVLGILPNLFSSYNLKIAIVYS